MNLIESLSEDMLAIIWSGLFVLAVIGVSELARRQGVDRSVTRKIVHVGVGTWVIPTFLLFEHRIWAVAPALCFVMINALSYRFNLIRSVEGEERNIGTILYPMSVAAALALFWVPPWPVVGSAAILVMAWGDAAGSLVGRRWGRRIYRIKGHPRSLEGSAAMLLFSMAAGVVSFAAFGAPLTSGVLLAIAIAAFVATLLEAISLWGFDNILVPASVAATMYLTHGSVW